MLLTLSSAISWLKNNVLYIIIIGLLAWTIKGQNEQIASLETKLETIKQFQSNAVENAKPVQDAMLKSPKATKQMERIVEKKPQLLEKRMNAGFQQLTDRIQETTK
ncbi:hypothetical protein OFDDKENP_00220 [Aeromonas phage B614]|nr:hypothetical protein OFDDKENP_00220 [Aeromonas phage B614]UYD58303.1 hypothetical protein JNEOFJEA_00224 [Aeromonas phage UP87]UYD58417.1 hypothetical protein IPAKJDPM_00074 [Aeromonas phage avDM14-QBC]UYD58633.1 hypothetical protein HNNIDBEH_00040 [Aeromonas phage avDM10-HWA]UYD59064.1 hypothetical protein OFOPOMKI_00214 [Aeromonas phage avDM7-IJDJ]UYD59876.1 hypothetical protein LEHPIFIF_00103 [Aeromonas phage avDM9-HANS]